MVLYYHVRYKYSENHLSIIESKTWFNFELRTRANYSLYLNKNLLNQLENEFGFLGNRSRLIEITIGCFLNEKLSEHDLIQKVRSVQT